MRLCRIVHAFVRGYSEVQDHEHFAGIVTRLIVNHKFSVMHFYVNEQSPSILLLLQLISQNPRFLLAVAGQSRSLPFPRQKLPFR